MSSVLTLLLAGPLQSWGSSARFARRTTENAPTKSGVIGLLAAAQGIHRDDEEGLARLASLRFGVRIDQPGTRLRDFQTAHHADTDEPAPVSERFYLCDAVFLAAVEGPHEQLTELHTALCRPEFLPYLGRRSCPPAERIPREVHADTRLEDVLRSTPWLASSWHRERTWSRQESVDLAILVESAGKEQAAKGDTVRDQPLSYDPRHRRYALRTVHATSTTIPHPQAKTDHDPVSHLGEALGEA